MTLFNRANAMNKCILFAGRDDLLWKGDFAKMFLRRFPDLRLVKERTVKYLKNENLDQMYLLEAGAAE